MDAERPVYRVSCAGCGEVRRFTSADDLARWAQDHRCWEVPRD